jgi:tetratricopeptide (TPR) repeat protein
MQELGKYRLCGVLSHGGVGPLYGAVDTTLDRRVLIRMLSARLAGDSALRESFRQQVQFAGSLIHPHIATIYDIGDAEDGCPYVVMEYVEGSGLDAMLADGATERPLSWRVGVLTHACEAMAYAHRKGVPHLGLRPSNIRVGPNGEVKVLGFGLSGLESTAATRSGLSPADVQYLAPEQVEDRSLDARSDVFSIGAIGYELLTSRPPFAGETVPSVLFAIVNRAPDPQPLPEAEAVPGGRDLRSIIMKALGRRPEERYQSLDEALDDLEGLVWVGPQEERGSEQPSAAVYQEAARWLTQGLRLMADGEPAGALRCARQALTLLPDDMRAQALAREAGRASWHAKAQRTAAARRQIAEAAPIVEEGHYIDIHAYILEEPEVGQESSTVRALGERVTQMAAHRRASVASRLSLVAAGGGARTVPLPGPGARGPRSYTAMALRRFLQNDYAGARRAVEQALALDPADRRATELRTILSALD